MFWRDNQEILTFRVYDSVGNCISEYTGTMDEWQKNVAPLLLATSRTRLEKRETLN